MDDDVLRQIGLAYLADNPAPWWLHDSYDQLSDLLAHPSRAMAVFAPDTSPQDALARAAFEQMRVPYSDGIALLGPRFAVSYAMQRAGGRHRALAYFNWVEASDTPATVATALSLWDRHPGAGSQFFLLDQAFAAARGVMAVR